MSLRYPHSSGEIQRGWNNGIYNEVFVLLSIRKVATPRGLAQRARLGARYDPQFLYCFLWFYEGKPLSAPLVQESDAMPAASSAKAGSQKEH